MGFSYTTIGKGEPIVFLHGLGASGKVWKGVLSCLENSFQLINIDLGGFGRSQEEDRELTLDYWIDGVLQILTDLGIKKVHLVGHSLGSFISLAIALRNTQLIKTVTAISTLPEFDESISKAFKQRATKVREYGLESVLDDIIRTGFSKLTLESKPDLVDYYRKLVAENGRNQYAKACESVNRLSIKSELSNIKCPVQIIVGVEDVITPVEKSEFVRQAIPESLFFTLENAGHQVHLECHERIADMIQSFVK
jgi:pimeloyl-ACP methyl ester carboxylesterase